jgi:hypothetical protein
LILGEQILISGFIRMQLSEEHIDKFIALYEKHFGIVLDRKTALEKGLKLCRFVEIVAFEPKDNKSDRQVNY